jgi:hypothetical protein
LTKELDGSEVYVVARFMNDMEVMAILDGEDNKFVKLLHCMEVRMLPEQNAEGKTTYTRFAALPLTQFSDDPSYIIDKSHILYIKKLSKDMKEHYRSIIMAPETLEDLDEWDEWVGEEEEELDIEVDTKIIH